MIFWEVQDARIGRIFEGPTETMMYYLGSRFMLDPENLVGFIETRLGADDIVQRMLDAKNEIYTRCKSLISPFGGMRKIHLGNSLMGEVVHWGVLFSVSRFLSKGSMKDNAKTIEWVEGEFESSILRATSGSVLEKISLDPDDIKNEIAGYEMNIGNMEQTLPGEEWELDSYLQIKHPTQPISC